ncbi:MAG: nucleotidyltransferase domain-containing protein [Chloroflexi bacterium]|nr:nucleotidyltransferase domain-containing protein [Chloroflexota bacterium]
MVGRYRDELGSLGIQVTAVFLYGSHARGTHREDSDIDLIVVSPDFAKLNVRERLELLGVAAARVLEPIQAYGFTPQEIERRTLASLWDDILAHEAVPIPG